MLEMDQLGLETAEEIFCYGVVVRIAFAGHTLLDAVGLQALLEGKCGVLDASVTVKDEPLGEIAAADRHVQCFQGQCGIHVAGKGITHNFACTQFLYDGQIEPALSRGM